MIAKDHKTNTKHNHKIRKRKMTEIDPPAKEPSQYDSKEIKKQEDPVMMLTKENLLMKYDDNVKHYTQTNNIMSHFVISEHQDSNINRL